MSDADTLSALRASLLNTSGSTPLHERFRTLFTLKSLKTQEAIDIISEAFADESALLKHELAYCLGQMKNKSAIPTLEKVLQDESEDPMVRHEAAEALGAISATTSIPLLQKYLNDADRSVRETCEIALEKLKWDDSEEGRDHWERATAESSYASIDPAPPTSGLLRAKPSLASTSPESIAELRSKLLNAELPLFERYRAMFGLRNIGTPEAVDALADGFADSSPLFKHEIAFVFGQMLSPHSVPSLIRVLEDGQESDMVRHEAAEALGGIGTPEVLPHLKEWMTREDSPRVVKESCQVAVDMWEYENSDQFQYADGLNKAPAVVSVAA